MKNSKNTMAKLITAALLVSLFTLNGCMLKRVFSDDESGMGMHGGGMQHGTMHEGMMGSDEDE